ncbi:hypothetical protein L611_003900000160 [Aminobacter sp. J15]|nr:hypothetical protein L611_003900000160 [Aminobacter sp. J15]
MLIGGQTETILTLNAHQPFDRLLAVVQPIRFEAVLGLD